MIKIILWWHPKQLIAKEVKRSGGWWGYVCGDVFGFPVISQEWKELLEIPGVKQLDFTVLWISWFLRGSHLKVGAWRAQILGKTRPVSKTNKMIKRIDFEMGPSVKSVSRPMASTTTKISTKKFHFPTWLRRGGGAGPDPFVVKDYKNRPFFNPSLTNSFQFWVPIISLFWSYILETNVQKGGKAVGSL